MSKCSFCAKDLDAGTGMMYIRKDGKIFYFHSSKCEKNMLKLGRDPRNVKWVATQNKVKTQQ